MKSWFGIDEDFFRKEAEKAKADFKKLRQQQVQLAIKLCQQQVQLAINILKDNGLSEDKAKLIAEKIWGLYRNDPFPVDD